MGACAKPSRRDSASERAGVRPCSLEGIEGVPRNGGCKEQLVSLWLSLNSLLHVQTLMLTDVQIPFLGTPLASPKCGGSASRVGAERDQGREDALEDRPIIDYVLYVRCYIMLCYIIIYYIIARRRRDQFASSACLTSRPQPEADTRKESVWSSALHKV